LTQYTPRTWMNRNRVLHPSTGWQYVTVPLANSSISTKTLDARILDRAQAKSALTGKLSHYRKKAPYYRAVSRLVDEVFDGATDDSLVHLNVRALAAVCDYLGIPFAYRICSELGLSLPEGLGPGEWALEICAGLGATGYLNPASGQELFDPAAFARRGIRLYFAQPKEFAYSTGPYQYEPHLSILDVLMWNAPQDVAQAVRRCVQISEGNLVMHDGA
ncbi:MAG: WbqC family protein, partial [Betaproteobacteria bacterium]|nr:WbqC family protein [Betaproteobacteria bacterium]